jgi:hypothetical protein
VLRYDANLPMIDSVLLMKNVETTVPPSTSLGDNSASHAYIGETGTKSTQ